jgi:hypothetical protein
MGQNIGQVKDYAYVHMNHQEEQDMDIHPRRTYSTPTVLSQSVTHSTTPITATE